VLLRDLRAPDRLLFVVAGDRLTGLATLECLAPDASAGLGASIKALS
jgi:hypothetical protein